MNKKDFFQCVISYGEKITQTTNLKEINMKEVLQIIKSEKYKVHTEYLRSETDKEKRSNYKRNNLPYVNFNGKFEKRSNDQLIKASGFMILDYDESYDLEKNQEIKQKLIDDNHVFSFFTSPSGGIKFLVKIPVVKSDIEFKGYYNGVVAYFKEKGIILDESGKDISRACFLSFDPDLFERQGETKTFKSYIEQKRVASTLNSEQGTDKSRSAIEYRNVCRLIGLGKSKTEVFEEMNAFSKWANSHDKYRENTYEKAKAYIEKNKKPKQGLQLNSENSFDIFETCAETFMSQYPIYYDINKNLFLYNPDDNKWVLGDERDLINIAKKLLNAQGLNTSKIRTSFLNALLDSARWNKPKEVNKYWIQFQNSFYNIIDGKKIPVTKDYFSQIKVPHKLGKSTETPIIDKKIILWVGKEQYKLFIQITSYCLLKAYPFARFFIFYGTGEDGKSTAGDFINRVIGEENSCCLDLDQLNVSRFESQKMYQKTLAICGEVDYKLLKNTRKLKGVTGGKGDPITIEFKNKNPFNYNNFAKILWYANGLPPTYDKSRGFYRRTTILKFPNKFEEKVDPLSDIPEIEYENFCLKCCNYLKDLLKNGFDEPNINEKTKMYEDLSNPIQKFFNEELIEKEGSFLTLTQIYQRYKKYANKNAFRDFPYNEFVNLFKILEEIEIVTKKVYITQPNKNVFLSSKDFNDIEYTRGNRLILQNFSFISTPSSSSKKNSKKLANISKDLGYNTEKETIYHKCVSCGALKSNYFLKSGLPVCIKCYNKSIEEEII